MITIVHETKEGFEKKQKDIEWIYKEAFGGFPFFIQYSDDDVHASIEEDKKRNGFQVFLAYKDGNLAGALWYYTVTFEKLRERIEKLSHVAQEKSKEYHISDMVMEKEIFVLPLYHRGGIATQLRLAFLNHLTSTYPNGVIMFTRMRSDNTGSITVAKKSGIEYCPTGVRTMTTLTTKEGKTIYHEYWYKIIK